MRQCFSIRNFFDALTHCLRRKINIWQASVILSPYLGPLLASFMITKLSWRWPFWIYTVETGLCLIAVILWGEETYYNRRLLWEKQPPRRSRLLRLIGVEQWRSRHLHNGFRESMTRAFRTVARPVVLLANLYYMCTFAWVVGINATLALFLTSLYDFGPKQIGTPPPHIHNLATPPPQKPPLTKKKNTGFFFFSPIIAALLAEAIGHHLHDSLAHLSMRRHRGHLNPEARLPATFLALPALLAGLVLFGFALDRRWHYALAALAWALYVFATMLVSVAVSAYLLDAYPRESGEVGAWINFSRTAGGFVVAYFQVRWVERVGAVVCFATQAAVCAAVAPVAVGLWVWGKRLRRWEERAALL